jgi:hypothetical protein
MGSSRLPHWCALEEYRRLLRASGIPSTSEGLVLVSILTNMSLLS